MTGYQQAILYLSGSMSGGRFLVRNVDRWYIDAISELFPTIPYLQQRQKNKREEWRIKSARVSPPFLSEVTDWQGFSRGFVELQGNLALWPHKTSRGNVISTPRLRIYGQPDVLQAVVANFPAAPKKMQHIKTNTGQTYLFAYQSPSEISDILAYLDGEPRNEALWQRWAQIMTGGTT